jgi:nucleoid DNA-binding protein
MKSKWVRILLLVLLCFAVFCVITVFTRIYTVDDLQINFVGALLGTVITAIVTVLLLNGQSSAEEVKERNVKVFEKKSEIFQEYIDIVWDIWDDHTVSDEEYLQLTSMYYKKLMLFLNKKSLDVIYDNLLVLGGLLGKEEGPDTRDDLQKCLIQIINTLSDEISLGGNVDLEKFKALDQKIENCRTRRTKTTFKMLNVKKGTELVFKGDNTKKCITIDENNTVEYNGKQYSISALSSELLNGVPSSGFVNFMLDGRTLADIRKEKEKK